MNIRQQEQFDTAKDKRARAKAKPERAKPEKMSRKAYEAELQKLQVELWALPLPPRCPEANVNVNHSPKLYCRWSAVGAATHSILTVAAATLVSRGGPGPSGGRLTTIVMSDRIGLARCSSHPSFPCIRTRSTQQRC